MSAALQKFDPWHSNYKSFLKRPETAGVKSNDTDQSRMILLQSAKNPLPRPYSADKQVSLPYRRALDIVVPSYHHGPLNGRALSASLVPRRPEIQHYPANITSYSKFTPADWTQRNLQHYAVAETTRNLSEKIRSDAFNILRETDEVTQQSQKEVGKRLGERISDISYWSYELDNELDKLIVETNNLSNMKQQLQKALADTEQPFRVAQECLYFREKRQAMDLVYDKVEELLIKEVDVIKHCQEKFRLLIDKQQEQLRANRAIQHQLEQDLQHKHDALHIDSTCHILTNTSQSISHHQGVESIDNSLSVPNTWADFSNRNVQQSQLERTASARLRAEAEALIASCSSDIWLTYNNTNVSLSNRMTESQDAQRGLQAHLSKISQEIYELERNVEFLKRAIKSKMPPLKLAQTRLEARLHRPNVELCYDPPHIRLVSEVQELKDNIEKLEAKLHESEETLQQLVQVRSQLEQELKVKANSIFIDREQCQGLRKSFPYRIAYSI